MTGQVEPRANLLDQLRGHASPLGRRVQPHPPQVVAEGIGNAERLLGLVLEGVDQDDPRDIGVDVAVERLRRAHGVTEDEDEGMRHGAGRRQAGQAGAGRGGGADAAADHAGVVHLVRHAGMHVPRAEADHRDRVGSVDDATCGGRPSGAGGQDAQDGRLVEPER